MSFGLRSRTAPRTGSLAAAAPGTQVRVTAVDAAPELRRRLAELGVRTGTTVTVLARTAGGGRVLGLGADRLAIDAAMTSCLFAEIAGTVPAPVHDRVFFSGTVAVGPAA